MMQDRKGEENRSVAKSCVIQNGFKEGDVTTTVLLGKGNAWQWAPPATTVSVTKSGQGVPASTTSHDICTDVPPLISRTQGSSMAHKKECQLGASAESAWRVERTLAIGGSQIQCEELSPTRTFEAVGNNKILNTCSRARGEWHGRGNTASYGVPGGWVTSARAQHGVAAVEVKSPATQTALPRVRSEAPSSTTPENSKRIEHPATPGAGVEELVKSEASMPSIEEEERLSDGPDLAVEYFERVSAGRPMSSKSQEQMASVDWKPAMGGVQRSLGVFNRVPAWVRSATRLDQNADKRGDTQKASPTNLPRKPTRATKKSLATARKRSSKKGLARECMQSFHPSSVPHKTYSNLRETLERTTGTVACAQQTLDTSAEDIVPLKDKKLGSPSSEIALQRRCIPMDIVEDAGRMAEAVKTQTPLPIGIDCLLAEVEGVCKGPRNLTWTTAAGEHPDEHLDVLQSWKPAHVQYLQGDGW